MTDRMARKNQPDAPLVSATETPPIAITPDVPSRGYVKIGYLFAATGALLFSTKAIVIKLAYHMFRRAENTDALYNAGGGVVRTAEAGDSRDVGDEIDLTIIYKASREVKIAGGISQFSAGKFIKESGASDDINFGFVQAHYTF